MNIQKTLIGPFSQMVTMAGLPEYGSISNDHLEIFNDYGIIIEEGKILELAKFKLLKEKAILENILIDELAKEYVLLPGFIDSHTHICFAGSRAADYTLRSEGKSYLEISKIGGGIMDTVRKTRMATLKDLVDDLKQRCDVLISEGVTTCEVKSGYGLTVKDEIKILQAIKIVNDSQKIDLIATALPAHTCPPEFKDATIYIRFICQELLPEIIKQQLAGRVDIFIEDGAFNYEQGKIYIEKAKELGFSITIHADQFSLGGSMLAAKSKAVSADHLEASTEVEIIHLARNNVPGTVLPGASLGLGIPYAPARKMLNYGMKLVIASDWNPGSAPMGDLLIQASLLGIYEKLNAAEIFAGITVNAASVLNLPDKGKIQKGMDADLIAFPCSNYKEILYRQGKLKPELVWKNGIKVI